MKKILFLIVFLAVVGGGVYFAFLRNPGLNVKIDFENPSEVMMGEVFEVKISYANNSSETLKNARLSVSLPDNMYFVGRSEGQRVSEDGLGDVGSGKRSDKTYKLIALRETQTVKRIEARMIYSLDSSRGQFDSKGKTDIVIDKPVITLNLETPESVFSGEEFEIILNYKNQSPDNIRNARIKMQYPPAFTFATADPKPDVGQNEWNLEALNSNSEGKISIKGSAIGEEDASFVFNVSLFSTDSGQNYELQGQAATINIKRASLSIDIGVNNSDKYVAKIGDVLNYSLVYRNNSDSSLQNIVIKAFISGELFDLQSVRSEGSFNSTNNTIVWNVANVGNLQSLAPGEQRTVNFEVRLKDSFPIRRLSDKNYSLKVRAEIESPTVPTGVSASKTISVASLETKVAGQIKLEATAFYIDNSLGSANTGPYPPRANQKTQYTVHWKIINYSTDVSNVRVSAFLQADSKFTGKIAPTDNPPKFNSRTGEITWDLPKIPATLGVVGAPNEVIFQIENTPAVNQVGDYVQFLSPARITAKDDWSGISLEGLSAALTTLLPHDTKISTDDRRVKP